MTIGLSGSIIRTPGTRRLIPDNYNQKTDSTLKCVNDVIYLFNYVTFIIDKRPTFVQQVLTI
jgi:hypothetical protein